MPLGIHAHRADHVLLTKHHAVDVDRQQIHLVEAPLQQLLQRFFAGFGRFPAHVRLRDPAGRGHLWQHSLILPGRDAAHQHVQHPAAQSGILHRFVGRNRHFAAALRPQPRLPHPQLPFLQAHPPPLTAVPAHFLSLLTGRPRPRHLLGGQLQHRLDRDAPSHVDQFVDGQPRLLDQIHHREQHLSVPAQELSQPPWVWFPRLDDRVVVSLQGGSPFLSKVCNPTLPRAGLRTAPQPSTMDGTPSDSGRVITCGRQKQGADTTSLCVSDSGLLIAFDGRGDDQPLFNALLMNGFVVRP
ncbi:MAG TPA: hypothetical protein VF311_15480 [Terriglobales bacterium]